MSTFNDATYEQLDYLSQLTEVVISPHNELLSLIPARIELSWQDINANKYARGWGAPTYGLELQDLIRAKHPLPSMLQGKRLTVDQVFADILYCFQFDISPDFEIDFAGQQMTGSIAIVKTIHQLEDKELLALAVDAANGLLRRNRWAPAKVLRDRVLTVLNILNSGHGDTWIKTATLNGSFSYLAEQEIENTLRQAILDNRWRIRDVELIVQVGRWIQAYLDQDSSDAGLVNLMKMKFMVDKDKPIYSLEEVAHANPA